MALPAAFFALCSFVHILITRDQPSDGTRPCQTSANPPEPKATQYTRTSSKPKELLSAPLSAPIRIHPAGAVVQLTPIRCR